MTATIEETAAKSAQLTAEIKKVKQDVADNEAALATLVKGPSSVLSGEVITAFTHSLISKSGLWPLFDRVASKDNPVDQLSRGKTDGPWRLVDIEFPPTLTRELEHYLSS